VIKNGIFYLTEDRKERGLILIETIRKNIALANLEAVSRGLIVDDEKEIQVANNKSSQCGGEDLYPSLFWMSPHEVLTLAQSLRSTQRRSYLFPLNCGKL